MIKTKTGPGSKPAIHNKGKQRHPDRLGKLWKTIGTKLMKGSKAKYPKGDVNQPLICILNIDGQKFELTYSETNRIIETMSDAQTTYKKAVRLGMLDSDSGTPEVIEYTQYDSNGNVIAQRRRE